MWSCSLTTNSLASTLTGVSELGGRIFHLYADIIQPNPEVLRVILCLLVKHSQLHLQLVVLYGPQFLHTHTKTHLTFKTMKTH